MVYTLILTAEGFKNKNNSLFCAGKTRPMRESLLLLRLLGGQK